MVDPIFDYQFRLILIGDSTVGKSSLLKYFTDGKFAELSDPTVGVDFFARIIEVQDGTRIKLQLWDTAGQERFRSITKSYYRNSVGALLVYDVCNRSSFEHIPLWMMEAKRHIEPHRPVFALVGCKIDLVGTEAKNGARREVSCEEARMFAEENGLHHVETSARSGLNVEEAFVLVAQEVYNRIQTEIVQYCQNKSHSVQELQNKLSDIGQDVGTRILDLYFVRERNSKREIKLLNMLLFVKSTLWKVLFGKEADKLEHANDDERTYYIIEKDAVVNKFISVPKDKGSLNCATFNAGIIEAVLTKGGFPAKVTAHWHKGTTYMVKFDDSVITRDKSLDDR